MDKKQAQLLIEDTFNDSFNEERFTIFAKNLLNDLEPKHNVYAGNLLWDDYKEHINTYKRIGKYIDPEGEALDVLIVEVKSVQKLERARTALRNFVIKHLGKFEKDYALVAFYSKEDEGADWRFSFIKLEYRSELDEEKGKVKTKKEFTPAKRYSFLVGKYEKAHTAKNQLLPLLQNISNNPTIEELEAAFSIEKVTDEFFNQYKDLYIKLFEHFENDSQVKAEFEKAAIDNARFTKKLLGQIVFLYFLQKKGWLGVAKNERWGTGKKRFIQELYDQAQTDDVNFFKDKLQYLFYEALAKERDNVNSYYKRFDCRIPFLNGGLFEADYHWETANITIPETLFRNEDKNKSGDEGTGVLDVFDRYNFTIKEDEPLDKEVAVDPEMLGKVFENMLDITERKSKGAFYTPREIVHYMCQESLIHYLDNALNSGTPNSSPDKGRWPQAGGVKSSPSFKGGAGVVLNNLPHLKTFRKKLRNNLTPAEASLWKMLQGKQLDGHKFRRQHSVANYILDFYCPSEKIAIELDGQGHFEATQAEYDFERDLFLQHCGIKVLRFENKWVWDNPEGLLEEVKANFGWSTKQPPRPADTPPLEGGKQPPRPADTPPLEGGELLGVPKADIETYIREGHFALENDERVAAKGETKTYKYQLPESIRKNADLIDQKLTDIRICDPAIGSGAFPVGLLHELVNAMLVLKPHFSDDYLSKKLKNFSIPFKESYSESRYIYRLKRHIIQESIYGVDIDASAIDIARLRLWLSLVVDEDDLDPIETLPNLDYKIVCGNSLIGMPETAMRNLNVEAELEILKEQFYNITDDTKKKALRQEINTKIRELLDSAEQFAGYKIDFDFKLFFSEVWREKGGFDVVIGNPPYVEAKKLKHISSLLKIYEVYSGTADLSVYFIEKGIKLTNQNGLLALITTNKFFNTGYGKYVRSFIQKKNISHLINFEQVEVFEKVLVSSVIIGLENKHQKADYFTFEEFKGLKYLEFRRQFENKKKSFSNYSQKLLGDAEWTFSDPLELKIKRKIEENGTKIIDINGVQVFRGVTTGYNPAFIINSEKKEELIGADKKNSEIIKPLLQGRNIRKWIYNYNNENLVFIPWHFPLHLDNKISGSSEIAEQKLSQDYLSMYNHLLQYKEELSNRNKEETNIRYEWYALQRCAASYYPEFEKPEKIIWGLTADKWAFAYDDKQHFLPSNGYILTSEKISIKYILGILNSSVLHYYFGFIGVMTAGGAYTLKHATIQQLPVVLFDNKKVVIELVDYILEIKNSELNSIYLSFFESLLDSIVYELYFPSEIKSAGKEILKQLGDLKPITPLRPSGTSPQGEEQMSEEEKLAIIQSEFERLYDPNHPVRFAIETLDSVEEVRIIKEALK